jgi:hypothetical protein
MRLTLIFAAVLTASHPAFSQPTSYSQTDLDAAIKSGDPEAVARAVLGPPPECPPGRAAWCSRLQYESDKRASEEKLSRDLLNIDIEAAKRKWISAKDAYKKNPSTENELAVTEADARLRALVAKRDN